MFAEEALGHKSGVIILRKSKGCREMDNSWGRKQRQIFIYYFILKSINSGSVAYLIHLKKVTETWKKAQVIRYSSMSR